MTTPNVALLKQTLAYIEEHPQEWVQEEWRCGTAACFAGRAALLDGGQWINPESNFMVARDDDHPDHLYGRAGWQQRTPVENRARRILGLTRDQANALFSEGNTLDDLRAEVAKLTGGAS